ncbi:MAG: 3'-5' exonuclease [Bacteroidales bacterium]|uniref:3'-5' exonuclease n=1 Tax=Porphyromonas sp. TaxID=1924944 RepID=UPI0029783019|nr:3'-5' exonuclease [Porphyromonas sp.]MDD7437705.1 3'-5' exonuclease [Bacteroidales bacterium]MDY3067588.1 3'-5' exonuclease [Porphyromonas sp.]
MPRLSLKRPIVFFDLETTGLDVAKDRIIEIALLKVYPDGLEESFHTLVHPGIPIPPESSAVHGITDELVADKPRFAEVGKRIAAFIENCDLGGYNCNRFDVPLLAEELQRAGIPVDFSSRRVVDVQVIYYKKEPRTLSAAYKYYVNKELEGAHSADADTRATYEVLLGQLGMYDDLPSDVEALDAYTKQGNNVDLGGRMVYDTNGVPCFNFGKYKGMPVEEVLLRDKGYFDWIMQGDFPMDTKMHLQRIAIKSKR